MTALNLVDSAAAVPPAAAVSAGLAGVIRYVSQEPSKNLTADEAAGYLAAGLTVNVVYEDGSLDYEGGAAAGAQHGAIAEQLLDAIGFPADRALIVAVDTDIAAADYPLGLVYVSTTASAAGRASGVYGPDAFVRYCMANGISYGMNAAGWNDGVANSAQILQGATQVDVGGTTCDTDTAVASDYGQWPYTAPDDPPPVYIAATPISGQPGQAWFLRASGEVDGRDVAGAAVTAYGGTEGKKLDKPVIGIASAPSGKGYWIVAEDGGVFTYGDADFHGSLGGDELNKPIVALIPTPTGDGYLLVAADGGTFALGKARFEGSAAVEHLNAPVVGGAGNFSGGGYWLVASDGGVFTFGDAPFSGSGAGGGTSPAVGVAACGDGYVLARSDGSVEAFSTPLNGDYPLLPPAEREGVRRFIGIAGAADGSYTLFGSDGTQYHFPG
jgi:hypothetical protein